MVISPPKVTLRQHKPLISKNIIDKTGHLLILLPGKEKSRKKAPAWPDFPYREPLQTRWKNLTGAGKNKSLLITDLPNRAATRVFLAQTSPDSSVFEQLGQAREIMSAILADDPASLAIIMPGLNEAQQKNVGEALISAALAACHTLPAFSKKAPAAKKLKSIHLYGCTARLPGKRLLAEAEGNNLARSLGMMPPNKLTPGLYRKHIKQLAAEQGWRMQVMDSKILKRKKAGAFLAVIQGSQQDDAAIVKLSYKPRTGNKKPGISLVGKGLCYDTGGLNLKPARHMHGMHEDMTGSAVALGTLLALSRLQVPFPVDCWLALAENHIGPGAYKQNDVITAANGTSIEVIHTDAEGRMVLADTLHFAAKDKPALIIDYATLTGSCVYALSTRYSGVLTNREQLHSALIEAGRRSGERVWPFPLEDDFGDALKSEVADIKQCTLDGEADHILAALFLKRFVNDRPWVHIDLSAGNHRGGLAHINSDTTGFGIRYTLNLLLDQQPLETLSS